MQYCIQGNTKTCSRRTITKPAANALVLAGGDATLSVTVVLFATSIHRMAGMGKAYWVLWAFVIA